MAAFSGFRTLLPDVVTELTDSDTEVFRAQVQEAQDVYLMASTGPEDVPQIGAGGSVLLRGFDLLPDTIAGQWPGVTGGVRIFGWSVNGPCKVSISHD